MLTPLHNGPACACSWKGNSEARSSSWQTNPPPDEGLTHGDWRKWLQPTFDAPQGLHEQSFEIKWSQQDLHLQGEWEEPSSRAPAAAGRRARCRSTGQEHRGKGFRSCSELLGQRAAGREGRSGRAQSPPERPSVVERGPWQQYPPLLSLGAAPRPWSLPLPPQPRSWMACMEALQSPKLPQHSTCASQSNALTH